MIARVEGELGPVDILINNAGVTRDSSLKKMARDDWDAVINIDLSGAFNMTRQILAGCWNANGAYRKHFFNQWAERSVWSS